MNVLFLISMLAEWLIPAAALLGWITWEHILDRGNSEAPVSRFP